MRSLKVLLVLALLWVLSPANANAQTPSVTATPSPSPSPVAIPSPVPLLGRTSHFGFIGTDPANGGLLGGRIITLKATAALLVGQVVVPDPSNDRQVVFAPAGATNPIGVVVGAGTPAAAGQQQGIGQSPGAGQVAAIQINGVVQAICDGTIARGTKMMVSTSIVGGITTYSAGTVDEQIGVLLSSCTNANPGYLLLYK